MPDREALRLLATHQSSMVVFLSTGMIPRVVDEFVAAEYDLETPVAVVYRASWPDQLVVRGTLGDIAGKVEAAEVTHQALIIVRPRPRPEKDQGNGSARFTPLRRRDGFERAPAFDRHRDLDERGQPSWDSVYTSC